MNIIDEDRINMLIKEKTPTELAIGYLRYEKVRKLRARAYAELDQKWMEMFDSGVRKTFDELVDELP